ncbi:MAG TPA: hypothetical protein DHV89_02380 [Ruminococcus sp.]|nr:hypothetical protein [Ruminococcus sp.]
MQNASLIQFSQNFSTISDSVVPDLYLCDISMPCSFAFNARYVADRTTELFNKFLFVVRR